MSDARTLLSRALDGFGNRLAVVPADAWDVPTPCEGWAVRDLVAHVVEEERWAGAVLAGAAPDDLAGEDVDEAPARAWHHAASTLRTAIAEPGVVDVTVRTSSGEISGAALLHELFADHLIHTWDLARAIGAEERLDDDLVEACTGWFDAHEQQWRDNGEIGPPAPVRDDADAQTQLLARFARAAQSPRRRSR